MRGLFNINTDADCWTEEFFPDNSLYTLPIAGKPLGEYYLDLCSRLGLESTRIIDFNFDPHWSQKLREMNKWPMQIEYRGGRYGRDLHKLLQQHREYCGQDTLLVISGFIFVHYDIRTVSSLNLAVVQDDDDCSGEGVFLFQSGKISRLPLTFTPIRSIQDYFRLNFAVLHQDACYTLPAYKVEAGVLTGMNDVIMPNVEIAPPVLLGDNVLLQRGCKLTGDVIIGQNVIVDQDCHLKSCIIFDNSFIGEGMELVNKIISSQRIIDPYTAAYILIEDDCFVSEMRNVWKQDASVLLDYLIALSLVVVMTIPFLISIVLRWIFGKHSRFFYKLSLDRYPGLLKVLSWRYPLVGSSDSSPGQTAVFSYSDSFSLARSNVQRELDDSYFRLHNHFHMRLSIVVKALINRLFVTDAQRRHGLNTDETRTEHGLYTDGTRTLHGR